MGRGLVAAGVMGQIRSSVRAYAALDWTPAHVLAAVDGLVAASGEGSPDVRIATCIYGVLDPTTDELELACAGHVPPLVIDANGARSLDLPTGPPLGLGAGGYTGTLTTLPVGTMLALCSDGLVESRDTDLSDGLAALGHFLTKGRISLPELCVAAMELCPGTGTDSDDAVLLLASVTSPMPRFIESIPFTARAAEYSRRRVTDALVSWDAADLVERATLCVSEVVTNALEHGRGPLELRVRLAADALHVEVHDSGRRLPEPRDALPDDESGRGLAIVDAVSDGWGSRLRSVGKVVWFTLRRVSESE
jgi:anti-sigma regulatory factor (Ser/Thr protein kinase)